MNKLISSITKLTIVILLVIPFTCHAQFQNQNRIVGEPSPFEFVQGQQEASPLNYQEVVESIQYPSAIRDAGIEGQVQLRVFVDETGSYSKHLVLSSPHQKLTQAVEARIGGLAFRPASLKGVRKASWVTIPFNFRVQN
ncbi:MAG: TonB family protein [Bacteroidota bacterium]